MRWKTKAIATVAATAALAAALAAGGLAYAATPHLRGGITAARMLLHDVPASICAAEGDDCREPDTTDPGSGPGGGSGNGGGGSGGGSGGSAGGGGGGGGPEPGEQPFISFPEVTVIGHALPEAEFGPAPGPPPAVQFPINGIGGAAEVSNGAQEIARGPVQENRGDCLRNGSNHEVKISQSYAYQVNWQVSGGVTAGATAALSISLNVQLNTQTTRTTQIEVTLPGGGSFALYTQYQTVTYKVTWYDVWGSHVEVVNVSQPTGVVRTGSC